MVKTKPELLPPRREATPSGTPTSMSTRHATGKREAVVQLDEVALAIGAVNVRRIRRAEGHGVEAVSMRPRCTSLCWLSARGMSVVVKVEMLDCARLVGHGFVAQSVAQAHDQFLRVVVDDGGRSGGGDHGIGRIADVGHEDLAPVGRARAGAHVLHVEHEVLEVLVEDARLNLVGGLRSFKRLLHLENGLVGARREIERVAQTEQRSGDGDDGADAHKVADAQSRGAHGDNFAVGGQAAQPRAERPPAPPWEW